MPWACNYKEAVMLIGLIFVEFAYIFSARKHLKIGMNMKAANIFSAQGDDVINMMNNAGFFGKAISFFIKLLNLDSVKPRRSCSFYNPLSQASAHGDFCFIFSIVFLIALPLFFWIFYESTHCRHCTRRRTGKLIELGSAREPWGAAVREQIRGKSSGPVQPGGRGRAGKTTRRIDIHAFFESTRRRHPHRRRRGNRSWKSEAKQFQRSDGNPWWPRPLYKWCGT